MAVGADRAAIDNIRINRANLSQTVYSIPADGGDFSLDVDLNFNTAWEVRRPAESPSWYQGSESSYYGDRTIGFAVIENLTEESRVATFEVGSTELGYQTVTLEQAASEAPRLTPEETFPIPEFNYAQAGTGEPWFGLAEASSTGGPALIATGLEIGEFATLTATTATPGFLSFEYVAGVSEFDEARYFINGEAVEMDKLTSGSTLNRGFVNVILSEETNSITWRYVRNDDSAHNAVRIQNLKFTPGRFLRDETIVPAQGGERAFSLDLAADIAWKVLSRNDEYRVAALPSTGNGSASGKLTIGANPVRDGYSKEFSLVIDGETFSVPLAQEAPVETSLAEALDQPGLAFNSNNPEDQTFPTSFTIGQDAFHKDGRDAVAFSLYGDPEISTTITGPAQVTFDSYTEPQYVTRFGAFLVYVDNSLVHAEAEPSRQWQTFSISIPSGTTSEIRWKKDGFGFLFLDRLRITRPGDLKQGITSDGSGGLWVASQTGPTTPTSSEDWVTFMRNGPLIEAVFTPLPDGAVSRFGTFEFEGKIYPLVQLRPQVVDAEYLAAVGAANSDDLYLNSSLSPLGDLNEDGVANALAWAFGQEPSLPFLLSPLGPSGGSLTLRNSPWVTPFIRHSNNLTDWNEQEFFQVSDQWEIENPGQAFEIFSQTETSPILSEIELSLPAHNTRSFYQTGVKGR